MDKEKTLSAITILAEEGLISEREVRDAFEVGAIAREPQRHKVGISDVLYYLGAGIVVAGIAIFIGQKWSILSDITKVLATLGAGIAAYFVGVLFGIYKQLEGPSSGFHLLGAFLLPGGIHVLFIDVFKWQETLAGSTTVIGGLFMLYIFSYFIFHKKSIFLLFSILFGTGFYFLFTDWLGEGSMLGEDYALYRVLGAGLTYMVLGYAFQYKDMQKGIIAFLNFFGIVAFLGSAMALGGWTPTAWDNILFEVIYAGLALGVIFLSTFLKSRAYLILGTLFLMGYIAKITGEYFADSTNWPLALIIIGFSFIAIGYGALELNKKYLKR